MEAIINKELDCYPFEITLKIENDSDLHDAINMFGNACTGNTFEVYEVLKDAYNSYPTK